MDENEIIELPRTVFGSAEPTMHFPQMMDVQCLKCGIECSVSDFSFVCVSCGCSNFSIHRKACG